MDTYLISEGRHENLWHVLGAHVKTYTDELGETTGTAFAVWAPNARAVRVVGEFNFWDGVATSMRSLGSSGIWEIFVPDVGVGMRYKFEIQGPGGNWFQKADPLARATEIPPATASVVTDYFHEWTDDEWMSTRKDPQPPHRPHVHLRGPRGLVASGPGLPRAGRRAGPLRQADGLHARGVHAAG